MTRFDSYARAWPDRWAREHRQDLSSAAMAREIAERLARLLRDRYGATRVVLVGSLARGDFRRGSDIDLAAAGIPPGHFFRAGADLDAAADGLRVDLVPIETADPTFLQVLAAEGIVLHDANAA